MKLADYRLLGRSGLRVSPLCLGTMTFGTEMGWGADKKESRIIFDRYRELGGNFIDTANYYTHGTSEAYLGDFLKGRRDEVVLATKYSLNMRKGDPNAGGNHRKCLVQSLEASLKRLQTDYIDLYWLHIADRVTPIDEIMRALDDAVSSGKVLYIGVSDMPAWKISQGNTLADCKGWSPFIGLQIEYSLIERTAERDLLPMARELGLGVTPWSPLGASILTGKYTRADLDRLNRNGEPPVMEKGARPVTNRLNERNIAIAEEVVRVADELKVSAPQVALRWLLDQDGVSSVILGARKLSQLNDNIDCLDVALSDDHRRRLDDVSAISLGFPHDFINKPNIINLITGSTKIHGIR